MEVKFSYNPDGVRCVVFCGEVLDKLNAIYYRRKYNLPPGYADLDAVLTHIFGSMERKTRCDRCNADGVITDKTYQTNTCYTCPKCNGDGYVTKGE